MTFDKLSEKQKLVMKWAHLPKYAGYDAVICDGSVRSGKTVAMVIGFVHWAMKNFNNSSFAICGKTMAAVERNIIMPMMSMDDITAYYGIYYNSTKGVLVICSDNRQNRFYIFGGKDEQSYMMIQGMTLCGVLFDEVALMPRSFVEQAIARTLSEKNAKLWFNCNPDSPEHWFYKEWILDSENENLKRSLHIHFNMDDNPILDDEAKNKAKNMYDGVFKRRFIDGEWVNASGVIYSVFDDDTMVADCKDIPAKECFISIDYGTKNPCSMGVWTVYNGKAYRLREYYHDSAVTHKFLTDDEYYEQLKKLAGDLPVMSVVVDPSAASFIELIRRRGEFNVRRANNDVISGIRTVSGFMKSGRIIIDKSCKDFLREVHLYAWDDDSFVDRVIKQNDHAMDEMRYFCYTVLRRKVGFCDGELQIDSYGD